MEAPQRLGTPDGDIPLQALSRASIDILSEDILLLVLSFLPRNDNLIVGRVSKTFNRLSEDHTLWYVYSEKLGLSNLDPETHPKTEMKIYYNNFHNKVGIELFSFTAKRTGYAVFNKNETDEYELSRKPIETRPSVMHGRRLHLGQQDTLFVALRYINRSSQNPTQVHELIITQQNNSFCNRQTGPKYLWTVEGDRNNRNLINPTFERNGSVMTEPEKEYLDRLLTHKPCGLLSQAGGTFRESEKLTPQGKSVIELV